MCFVGVFLFRIRGIRVIRGDVHLFLFLLLSAQAFGAGLDRWEQLVVSDSDTRPRNGVRVTYLGTNGYQFEFKNHALLVDPYFSRVDPSAQVLLQPKAIRGRIALQKHFVRNPWKHLFPFRGSFRSACASSRRFGLVRSKPVLYNPGRC